ncbi:probable methyltransferase-like protein 24 [Ruditapes philippinarum]|uniref:probable methyltransferase-like protein 24 n=1 Tax=Ruditapes philippinarum TaxID=129788 RepID=UPI00295B942F|nr:probable methyltransferase-like protein 24 [Ruditapes philippinarum]
MTDQNVTLRVLYLTIVIIALFVTLGVISALHEHGFQDVQYPFYTSKTYDSRRRRDITNSPVKLNVTGPKHYRLPKDVILDGLSNINLTRVFWFYINTVQIGCKNITSLSSHHDGQKICQDKLKHSENNCLVYSIADNFNFEFESHVKKEYNCDVHAMFSPRLKHEDKDSEQINKDSSHDNDIKFPKGITIHRLELTEKSFDNEEKKSNKMFILIRKVFPKPNEIIDILKMDLDGEEWKIIPRLIDSGLLKKVRQLLIEIHFGWGEVPKSENLKMFRQLYVEGFRLLSCKHKMTSDSIEKFPNLTITNVNELTFMNARLRRKDFQW